MRYRIEGGPQHGEHLESDEVQPEGSAYIEARLEANGNDLNIVEVEYIIERRKKEAIAVYSRSRAQHVMTRW